MPRGFNEFRFQSVARAGAVVVFGVLLTAGCSSDPESGTARALADPAEAEEKASGADAVAGGEASQQTGIEATSVSFAEDFETDGWISRFDFDIQHRDDNVIHETAWLGDHATTGPDDVCSPPTETRTIARGERDEAFNDDWIYRCVPGGDLNKAHLMTSIGDTSGYSIGSFAPHDVFEGVSEVRWDVNITNLGVRQFVEVKVIPADMYDTQKMPCAIEWLPCDTTTHGELGSVGVSLFNHELAINNGEETIGGPYDVSDDPALTDVAIRRQHVFTDNGDGTLSYSVEREDGSFQTVTAEGAFPDGPVRVVFADHNYTPEKDNDPIGFTWHWDNIEVHALESVS